MTYDAGHAPVVHERPRTREQMKKFIQHVRLHCWLSDLLLLWWAEQGTPSSSQRILQCLPIKCILEAIDVIYCLYAMWHINHWCVPRHAICQDHYSFIIWKMLDHAIIMRHIMLVVTLLIQHCCTCSIVMKTFNN